LTARRICTSLVLASNREHFMQLRNQVRLLALLLLAFMPAAYAADLPKPLRPPAVPLITHDPYFSVWSFNDQLHQDWPKHWTGIVHALCGLVRIDNRTYRYMGNGPDGAEAMKQTSLQVLPTRTIYQFESGGVRLTLTFLSPLLPQDMDMVSKPITFITWSVQSIDEKPHSVQIYLDATGELAVNKVEQKVVWDRQITTGLDLVRIGTEEQPVLAKKGDNLRIDWGYLYLAVPQMKTNRTVAAPAHTTRTSFAEKGTIPEEDDEKMPIEVKDNWPALACRLDLGEVKSEPVTRHIMLCYDDEHSIEYMNKPLKPWWRRWGNHAPQVLTESEYEYAKIVERCEKFDAELMADLQKVGGEAYAQIGALGFRQAIAAHKLAYGVDGTALFFSKENFSNGCIATVDVTYPSAPMFLLFNVNLLKGMTTPILDYAQSDRWKFAFAPHDLGTYPKANGQVYGGGEKTERNQMPVEECGNMLILMAAIAQVEGNANYSKKYWPTLTKWADYLKEKGLDPENQLCTDDFAGHLAHNTNLSLKAIVALGAFAKLAEAAGENAQASTYRKAAEEMAAQWMKMADDGDHYRLTFDKPGTWSQKYNLVWDKLLGLKLFPPEVAKKEIAYYKTKQNKYGLPLDNRKAYTKLDWIMWTATLADNRGDFDALIEPIYIFLHESQSRVPMTDWYDTVSGKKSGFQARSVVGGVFIPMLADEAMWKKWSSRKK
jgi:hypothetical protein